MMQRKEILILNGPNLNMLGTREPDIYGSQTLDEIEHECCSYVSSLDVNLTFKQSNHEGELITWIQAMDYDGLIINAGAYTHSSIAIRDAISAIGKPSVELHLSNIHKREKFRRHSYLSAVVNGVIFGFGSMGYRLAISAIDNMLKENT